MFKSKSRNLLFLSILAMMFFAICHAYNHPGGIHTSAEFTAPHDQAAIDQVTALANTALSHTHHAVTDFNVPGYYVDPDGHTAAKQGLVSDVRDAYSCAIVWKLTGNTTYADKAKYFINAWSSINKSYSNADGSLCMCYCGVGMAFAADVLFGYTNWSSTDKNQCLTWASTVLDKAGDEIKSRANNWADWGILASIAVAQLKDDTTNMNNDITRLKAIIDSQISDTGVMPEEQSRGERHIWYAYFALAPMSAACQIAYNSTGQNLYLYNNSRIKKALDYYFPLWQNPPPDQLIQEKAYNLMEPMYSIYKVSSWWTYVSPQRPIERTDHHFAWCFPSLLKPVVSMTTSTPTPTPTSNPNATTYNPAADAFVRGGTYANTNYGTDVTLNVKSDSPDYTRKSYLMFDFSSFSGTINKATLRVNVSSTGTDSTRTIKVYGTSDETWTESGITWNNAPAGTTYITSFTVNTTAGVWYNVDVTTYVKNHSDKKVSFLLINEGAAGAQNYAIFHSRQATGNKPELVLEKSTATPTPAPTPSNLVLNKPVTYSSQQTGNEATHAVDGDIATRWSAEIYPQWIRVDLGATHSINKTEIAPYLDRAYRYKIEVSTDGTNYIQVVDRTNNMTGGPLLTDTFSAVSARYVRLTVTGAYNYTGTWVSILEFRVFGN